MFTAQLPLSHVSARPAGDGCLDLCNSPNGSKVLRKSLSKDTLKLLSSLPGSFATRTEVVEEDPACPRGPLSGCVSKQTPEHVTHSIHPRPAVLPFTGHGGGYRRPGFPHIPASPPRVPPATHGSVWDASWPVIEHLGMLCPHGDGRRPCRVHPAAVPLWNSPGTARAAAPAAPGREERCPSHGGGTNGASCSSA